MAAGDGSLVSEMAAALTTTTYSEGKAGSTVADGDVDGDVDGEDGLESEKAARRALADLASLLASAASGGAGSLLGQAQQRRQRIRTQEEVRLERRHAAEEAARTRERQELAKTAQSRRYWHSTLSSEDAGPTEGTGGDGDDVDGKDASAGMAMYHCTHCGSLSLVVDTRLDGLPVRPADGAVAVSEVRHRVTRFCKHERECLVELAAARATKDGAGQEQRLVERQFRQHCNGCDLPVSYRFAPTHPQAVGHEQSKTFPEPSPEAAACTYVIPGALTTDAHAAREAVNTRVQAALRELQAASAYD